MSSVFRRYYLVWVLLFNSMVSIGQLNLNVRDTTLCLSNNINVCANGNPQIIPPFVADDIFSDTIDIGFSFKYFGETYSKCIVSPNNFISFDLGFANIQSYFYYSGALASGQLDKAVLFPFQDLDITQGGTIRYMTVGQSPHRKFVIEFCKVPYFFCPSSNIPAQNQLILYESTNVIEMHIKQNACSSGWIGSPHSPVIQGIKNGATSIFIPGRGPNDAPWTINTTEGKRFSPQGSSYQITNIGYAPVPFLLPNNGTYSWYEGNTTTPFANTACATLTVNPSISYYRVNYNGSMGCDSIFHNLWDTVYIDYAPIYHQDTVQFCSNDLPTTWNGIYIPANAVSQNFFDSLTINLSGSCDSIVFYHLKINTPLVPNFNIQNSICEGSTTNPLRDTSLNGIIGTWSPSFNNQQSTTYTFTPAIGQCANNYIVTISVTPIETPAFPQLDLVCEGTPNSPLNNTSLNNIIGSWAPAFNNNQSGTYTFIPNPGQCATATNLNVNITNNTIPEFDSITPICYGTIIPPLPSTSTNGIQGSWYPAINNQQTTTYLFTPDSNQCAIAISKTIVVNNALTIPTFTAINPICSGNNLNLPTTSLNGIQGTWSPAINNTSTTTYTFTPNNNQCGQTTQMTVQVLPLITPQFTTVDTICAGIMSNFPLPTVSNNGITGIWNPAFNNLATTTYTFTPSIGQCSENTTAIVPVKINIVPTFDSIPPICEGDPLSPIPVISNNGITGTWSPAINNLNTTTYTFTPNLNTGICAEATTTTIVVRPLILPIFDAISNQCELTGSYNNLPLISTNGITGVWSPSVISPATNTYTFTPHSGQCAQSITINIQFNNSNTVPIFTPIGSICLGSVNVPTLPLVSQNNIAGTWNPSIINNTNSGSFTYTFTPNAGECGIPTTMQIDVVANIAVVFDSITPMCANTSANPLNNTSDNGITGTWFPVFNNQQTGTYTFVPNSGQCATSISTTIVIEENINPTFSSMPSYCQGSSIAALPAISQNGITGSWSPNINNLVTTNYIFTPSAGQCAHQAQQTIIIDLPATPTFNPVTPLCSGSLVNPLLDTSINGFIGNWTPVFDNSVSQTYTFTPQPNQCANTTTTFVQITDSTTIPIFAPIVPICEQSMLAPLPVTSQNGITGTWFPAMNNSQTTTYTFTPSSNQCGTVTTLTVIVDTSIIPNFAAIAPVCAGQNFSMPTTSINGITGAWSPVANNQQTTIYTFTPDLGLCASPTTMTVVVNNDINPTFSQNSVVCLGSTSAALPTTSNNGITGIWSPANINTSQTTSYTFTPNAGQCAVANQLTISVDTLVLPTFVQIMPHCVGWPMATLPSSSNEGVIGVWSPSPNNQQTTTYSFVPAAGQCAVDTVTMTIEIHPVITPSFNPVNPICIGGNLNSLPTISNNGVKGIWSPAINNTATTTYTFTPLAGQCANLFTMTIVVDTFVAPIFTQVAPICAGASMSALPVVSSNGVSGSWSPAINNTNTTTYIFSAGSGQCALDTNMTITVNPIVTPDFTQVASICQGEPLTPLPLVSNNGVSGLWSPNVMNNNSTTNYTFTPNSGAVCTLPASMQIVVNPYLLGTLNVSICEGETFVFNGIPYSQTITSGIYDTISNNNSCDSIIALQLVVKPKTYGFESVTICAGSVYLFNGQTYTTSNYMALDTLVNIAGCDSIVTLNLTVVPVSPINVAQTYQACGSYNYNGTNFFQDTTLNDTLYTIWGCDSICKNITIIIYPAYNEVETIDTFGCKFIVYQGREYTSSTQLIEIQNSIYGCDSFTRYINIEIHNFELNATFEPDLPYAGEMITITTHSDVGQNYNITHWEPLAVFADQQAKSQSIRLIEPTTIFVVGESKGCIDTAFIDVGQLPTYSSDFRMPNVFSPNGDGINDVFKPVFKIDRAYVIQDFRIYNRYGQAIYATSNSAAGWDGTFKNQPADQGVYFYTIRIKFADKTERTVKGDVTLIR